MLTCWTRVRCNLHAARQEKPYKDADISTYVAEYDDDEDGKMKEFKEKDGDLYLPTTRLN